MAYFQFLSTPSARRATSKSRPSIKPETFLSTPSARRATRYPGGDGSRLGDFYPRPPRGGRPRLRTRASLSWYFYPRPPRGGRRASLSVVDESFTFLSTPSARRATVALCNRNIGILISIHALREEGDTSAVTGTVIPSDFYPRPPRGGRLSHPSRFLFYRFISIHALREEGDLIVRLSVESSIIFLSTPSARRATTSSTTYTITQLISIHALREEGDPSSQGPLLCL